METAVAFIGQHFGGGRQQHIAGVQTGIHLHDGDTGFGLTVQNTGIDRACTAVFGQQGCMDVQTAVLGNIQHGLRQNAAISGHHNDLGLHIPQLLLNLLTAQILGLIDRNAVFQRLNLYRGRQHLHAAVFRGVHAGVNTHNVMSGFLQCHQCGNGEVGGSHKDNSHSSSPS